MRVPFGAGLTLVLTLVMGCHRIERKVYSLRAKSVVQDPFSLAKTELEEFAELNGLVSDTPRTTSKREVAYRSMGDPEDAIYVWLEQQSPSELLLLKAEQFHSGWHESGPFAGCVHSLEERFSGRFLLQELEPFHERD